MDKGRRVGSGWRGGKGGSQGSGPGGCWHRLALTQRQERCYKKSCYKANSPGHILLSPRQPQASRLLPSRFSSLPPSPALSVASPSPQTMLGVAPAVVIVSGAAGAAGAGGASSFKLGAVGAAGSAWSVATSPGWTGPPVSSTRRRHALLASPPSRDRPRFIGPRRSLWRRLSNHFLDETRKFREGALCLGRAEGCGGRGGRTSHGSHPDPECARCWPLRARTCHPAEP